MIECAIAALNLCWQRMGSNFACVPVLHQSPQWVAIT